MKALEEVRRRISGYDIDILELAQERARYCDNLAFYTRRNQPWKTNSAMFMYAKEFYLPKIMVPLYDIHRDNKSEWVAISELDERFITTLMQRTSLGVDIIKIKYPLGIPVRDQKVERKKIRQLLKRNKGILPEAAVEEIFKNIFEETVRIEENYVEEMKELRKMSGGCTGFNRKEYSIFW